MSFRLFQEGAIVIQELLSTIASNGDRGVVVPFSRVDDLKKDMMELRNGEYHTDWLNRMANHITDWALWKDDIRKDCEN